MRNTISIFLFVLLFSGSSYAQDYDELIRVAREHFFEKRTDSARFYLGKAISVNPENPEPYVLRSFTREYDEDDFLAIRDLDTAIHLSGDVAKFYFLRAKRKKSVRDFYGAMKDLDQSIKLDPAIPEAWELRSSVALNQDDAEKALQDINTAIGLDPGSGVYYKDRAFIYSVYLNKPTEGFSDFAKAYQLLKPTDDRSLEMLIDFATKAKVFDTAIFYSRIRLKRNPGSHSPLWNLGRCFRELGKKDSAIYYLTRAIEVRPIQGMFYMRSTVYFDQKNYATSIRDLDKAISIDSNYKQAYLQRAKVKLEGLKDINGALADYDKLIENNYDFGEAYYYRAMLYLKYLNDPQRACVDLQKAMYNDYKIPEGEMERVCDQTGIKSKG